MKVQKYRVLRPSRLANIHTGRVKDPNSTGTEAPVFRTLPVFTLGISTSFAYKRYASFIISFNKLVFVSKWFPELCDLI